MSRNLQYTLSFGARALPPVVAQRSRSPLITAQTSFLICDEADSILKVSDNGEAVRVVGNLPGGLVQTSSVQVTVDTSTNSVAFVPLEQQLGVPFLLAMTFNGATKARISFSVSWSNQQNPPNMSCFRVLLDGAPLRGTGAEGQGAGDPQSAPLELLTPLLAAGPHLFAVEWRTGGTTAQIRPVAAPDCEHASMVIQELG